jgi:hypothetical protein
MEPPEAPGWTQLGVVAAAYNSTPIDWPVIGLRVLVVSKYLKGCNYADVIDRS